MAETDAGASSNERLLFAARTDNVDMILEVFDSPDDNFDINWVDGLGNTALHIAIANKSTDILEHILSQEGCDVDPVNKIDGRTPLHLAVAEKEEDEEAIELQQYIVESLLEAGADTTIKDKYGDAAIDLLPPTSELRALMRKAQAQAQIGGDDIASDDDDEDASGSGSGSDE
ncbi:ankyrin repeat-containing domain protein [Mycena floridula]|nr:ankyrin repeat-containing domain protein [Mycena floridula]